MPVKLGYGLALIPLLLLWACGQGSGPAELTSLDLGIIVAGGARPDKVRVTVPEYTRSVTLTFDSPLKSNDRIWISEIRDPEGRLIFNYSDFTYEQNATHTFFSQTKSMFLTAMMPNTSTFTLKPGAYTLTLDTTNIPMTVKGTALFKSLSLEPIGATLRINAIFVGPLPVKAETAGGDADFQKLLDVLKRIYLGFGIVIQVAGMVDIDGPDGDELTDLINLRGVDDEIARLMSHPASILNNEAINVFFISRYRDAYTGADKNGVSGGIPGPPRHGTMHSGVLVALRSFQDLAEKRGCTTAHELGHYLGLFHVSESSGTRFDPLSDTPECPKSRDADGDGKVETSECLDHGSKNLMFWQNSEGRERLTAEQRRIIEAYPWVR